MAGDAFFLRPVGGSGLDEPADDAQDTREVEELREDAGQQPCQAGARIAALRTDATLEQLAVDPPLAVPALATARIGAHEKRSSAVRATSHDVDLAA